MAENNFAQKGSIRTYLAQHGGSVEDAGGRGLTDEMARALGVEKPAALSAVLGQMEADGVITREMKGLRTFRISLVDGDTPPSSPVPAAASRSTNRAGNMVGRYEPRPAEPAPAGSPDQPAGAAVRLRDAPSRRPNGSASAPVPVAATGSVAVDAGPGDAPDDAPPRRAVSLREAISQGAISQGASTTTTARSAPPAPPDSPPAPASPPAGRAVSLRDAIAGNTGYSVPAGADAEAPAPWERPSPAGNVSSLRDTARLTSLRQTAADAPAAPAWEEAGARKDTKEPRAKRQRRRPRLTVPVPSVKSAPSTPIVTAVGIAAAGLVLVTVITIVVSRGATHHVPATGTPDSSADACRVVTSADASAVFGGSAGDPHFVLGSCVYDDGAHELIVEVARQDGRALFDSSRSSSAKDIPGLGDSAYYADGRLRVLKGSTLMLITMTPFNVDTPSQKLVALAETAAGRL